MSPRDFLREFDLEAEDLPAFKDDLKANCDILDIEPADFIKSKARPFIITFKGNVLPYTE